MKQPSVTVLVTARNTSNTIQKCVDSLMRLNYKNYSVYITDAYSTDGNWQKLQDLKKKYGRRLRIERIRGNIARAHNHMITKVNSKLVAFTDADCVVDKEWLKNLVEGFDNEDIATTGFCGTPKDVNPLQKLIGKELEYRFRHAPKFVSRAPTMNLCVKTSYVKKHKFDEMFGVAQETEWGYRLTQFGKMRYIPKATVWHYHRPSWYSFLKQQFKQGRYVPEIYLTRFRKKITGDHISTPYMPIHILVLALSLISLLLTILNQFFITSFVLLSVLLFALFLSEILKLTKNPKEIFFYLAMFLLRTLAWGFGISFGIMDMIFKLR